MSQRIATVSYRLWLLVSLLLINLLAVGMVSAWNSFTISGHLSDSVGTDLPAIRNVDVVDMMHDGIRAIVYRSILILDGHDQSPFVEVEKEFEEAAHKISAHLNNVASLPLSESIKKDVSRAEPHIQAYLEQGRALLALVKQGKKSEVNKQIPKFERSFSDLEVDLGALGDQVEKQAENSADIGRDAILRSKIINIALVLGGLVIGLFSALAVMRNLRGTLSEITQALTEEAAHISSSAAQVRASSETLAVTSSEQAAALEETAASMEEIGAMIAQTVQNANDTIQESHSSTEESAKGKAVIEQMTKAMNDIHSGNEKLQRLVTLFSDIKDKTKIINDIAFETKLLSFNASIEAARAGSHGRGFAVVAEEVGKLATVSNRAADEVRTLLESSMREVSETVAESSDKVGTGREVAKACEMAFVAMESSLQRIDRSVQLIASAAKEQQVGVKQTNTSLTSMDRITHGNARNAEELSAQATALQSASLVLNEHASRMNMLVNGNAQAILNVRPGAAQKSVPGETKGDQLSTLAGSREPTKANVVSLPNTNKLDGIKEEEVLRSDSRWRAS